jgi:hypothetical protein
LPLVYLIFFKSRKLKVWFLTWSYFNRIFKDILQINESKRNLKSSDILVPPFFVIFQLRPCVHGRFGEKFFLPPEIVVILFLLLFIAAADVGRPDEWARGRCLQKG